jgi:hypothetical protein
MFSGVATGGGGAPRLPFPYVEDDRNDASKPRVMGRHDSLLFEVKLCKEFYGPIKFDHIKKGEKEKSIGVLDHQSATIAQCESYLRLYHERGNELSPSILKYLNTASAVVSSDWLTPLTRTDQGPLSSLQPYFFDPVNPSTTAKCIWHLKKDTSTGVVKIKKDEEDRRKHQGGIDRGNQLKLMHK